MLYFSFYIYSLITSFIRWYNNILGYLYLTYEHYVTSALFQSYESNVVFFIFVILKKNVRMPPQEELIQVQFQLRDCYSTLRMEKMY